MRSIRPKRRKTFQVMIGGVALGGRNPVRIQSMTNTETSDRRATLSQIRSLEKAGCEIVRVAVKDAASAAAVKFLKKKTAIPIVADVHFDWRLAAAALENGADKVRINPGNLGGLENLEKVAKACSRAGAAMRIGVNAGSMKAVRKSRKALKWSARRWAEEMVREAMEYSDFCVKSGFSNFVVSLKADDIERTVLANTLFASKCRIPLHIGITEAGSLLPGLVKSSIGLSRLLGSGIGETLRVSLTADPVLEVRAAHEILRVLGIRKYGPEIISCPTCGRCSVNVEKVVAGLEERIFSDSDLARKASGMKIAVMGCVVNGPGEAKEADLGIAGGRGSGVYFEKGRRVKTVNESDWIPLIIRKIKKGLCKK